MEDDDYKTRHFTYYSKIVMMIVTGIELILFIIFIVVIHNVQSIMNKIYNHYNKIIEFTNEFGSLDYEYIKINDFRFIFDEQTQAIDACFAFFVISFVIFLVEFIVNFSCENKDCGNGVLNLLFNQLNHILIILTFIIIQFLYVISCLIIPIYLDRVRTFKDFFKESIRNDIKDTKEPDIDLIDSCISKYAVLLVVSFAFLFIFLFLYFIIINLYKEVCCNMRVICDRTNRCLGNFGDCFFDNIFYFFTCCTMKDPELNDLIDQINNKKSEIAGKTSEIQNLMKENIDLRIENIQYL